MMSDLIIIIEELYKQDVLFRIMIRFSNDLVAIKTQMIGIEEFQEKFIIRLGNNKIINGNTELILKILPGFKTVGSPLLTCYFKKELNWSTANLRIMFHNI